MLRTSAVWRVKASPRDRFSYSCATLGLRFATEAARATIAYAFESLSAKALVAGHNPANDASRHLVQKLGFRYTHDQYYEPTGLNHPSYLLTDEEYADAKGYAP